MILHLAILMQYQHDRQTDRRTHGDSIYRASITSRGNKMLHKAANGNKKTYIPPLLALASGVTGGDGDADDAARFL